MALLLRALLITQVQVSYIKCSHGDSVEIPHQLIDKTTKSKKTRINDTIRNNKRLKYKTFSLPPVVTCCHVDTTCSFSDGLRHIFMRHVRSNFALLEPVTHRIQSNFNLQINGSRLIL